MFWTGIFSPSLDKDQWRRYVEAQRRVPPLGKKENNIFFEKEIREIFLFAKKVPLDILVLEFSYKKPDASWLLALSLRDACLP